METPDSSESSPSGIKSTNASVSSDVKLSHTAKMVLEFVEDVPAELAEYVRLGKFGMFKEASQVFDDLKRHLDWFPIAAEHCGLLLDKGDFRAVEEFVDKTIPSRKFTGQQEQLLSLFKSLAKLHTQDCVTEALTEARNAARHVDGTAMEILTATQMQMIILRLQISDLAKRISPQLVFSTDFRMPWASDATMTEILTFVQHLLHKDHFWKARSLLGGYLRGEISDDEKAWTTVQQFLARPETSDSSKEALVLAKVTIAVAFCEGIFYRLRHDERATEIEAAVFNEAQKLVRRPENSHALASSRPVDCLSILDTDKAVLQAASGTISGESISFDVLKKIEARAHRNDDVSLQRAVQWRVGGSSEYGVVEEREWPRNERLQLAYQELIRRNQKYSDQIRPLDSRTEAFRAKTSQTHPPKTNSTIYVDAKKTHEEHMFKTIQDPEPDQNMEGRYYKGKYTERHHVGNMVQVTAQQLNGNLGAQPMDSMNPSEDWGAQPMDSMDPNGSWDGNRATDKSQQFNGDDSIHIFFRPNVGSQPPGPQDATE